MREFINLQSAVLALTTVFAANVSYLFVLAPVTAATCRLISVKLHLTDTADFCKTCSLVLIKKNACWILFWHMKMSELMSDDDDKTLLLVSSTVIFSRCALLCNNRLRLVDKRYNDILSRYDNWLVLYYQGYIIIIMLYYSLRYSYYAVTTTISLKREKCCSVIGRWEAQARRHVEML